MATSLLQQTTIVPTILASYRWAQGYASLISHVSYCIYSKMHLTIFLLMQRDIIILAAKQA